MSFAAAVAKRAVRPDATVRYTFDTITLHSDKNPVLIVRYADSIPEFKSAMVKYGAEFRAHSSTGVDASPEMAIARAKRMAEILATTGVVTGWENVCDDAAPSADDPTATPVGPVPAPCTPAKVLE